MEKQNKKNLTYRAKPTRRVRLAKQHRQVMLLGIIVSLTAMLSVVQAYHLITLANELSTPAPITVANETMPKALSMMDYVLNEVEQAGIDKYKVYTLIQCESRWNDQAININNGGAYGLDFGLWQISTKYHPEVSPECSFDYKCATEQAIRIIKERTFDEWACGQINNL